MEEQNNDLSAKNEQHHDLNDLHRKLVAISRSIADLQGSVNSIVTIQQQENDTLAEIVAQLATIDAKIPAPSTIGVDGGKLSLSQKEKTP